MPSVSYLDPSIFNFTNTESILKDVEDLIERRKEIVKKEFSEFEKQYQKSKRKNEDWYQWQVDYYVDEMFLVSELEANLLNGLAVSTNTIFEKHVGLLVREISKLDSAVKYNNRHTYKMNELKKCLVKVKHPNCKKLNKELLHRLRIYTDIRNCIVHQDGAVPSSRSLKSFILNNKSLFNIKNEQLWIISVHGNYIRQVLKDLKTFFKLLCYTEKGEVIYY